MKPSDLDAAIERSGHANRMLRQCVWAVESGRATTIPPEVIREAAWILRQAAADLDALVGAP